MSETPREFYLRAVVKVGKLEMILGLEFNPETEDIEALRGKMKRLALDQVGYAMMVMASSIDVAVSDHVSKAMGERWPGRRYFLEVQHDDPDEGWVQVITPAGWPPKKEIT